MYFLKLFFVFLIFSILAYADGKFYTLSMCLTKDHDGAAYFLNRYLDEPESGYIYSQAWRTGRHLTTYGSFYLQKKDAASIYGSTPPEAQTT